MRRGIIVPVILLPLLLCACEGENADNGLVLDLRSDFQTMDTWAGQMDVTADYGQRVYEYTVSFAGSREEGTVLTILIISFGIFVINMLLRWSGLHTKANYFFSVETEGNFLLEKFYSWVPFPYLYLMPGYGILIPYMLLVTLPFEAADRIHQKKQNEGRLS